MNSGHRIMAAGCIYQYLAEDLQSNNAMVASIMYQA